MNTHKIQTVLCLTIARFHAYFALQVEANWLHKPTYSATKMTSALCIANGLHYGCYAAGNKFWDGVRV